MTTTQLKQILWAIAMFYVLSTPVAMLFDVFIWRIVVIILFEFIMMALLSVSMKQ